MYQQKRHTFYFDGKFLTFEATTINEKLLIHSSGVAKAIDKDDAYNTFLTIEEIKRVIFDTTLDKVVTFLFFMKWQLVPVMTLLVTQHPNRLAHAKAILDR